MRPFPLAALGLSALALIWACADADRSHDGTNAITAPEFGAMKAPNCPDLKDGEGATRRLFGQPEQGIAADHWKAIEDADCDPAAIRTDAFALVELISDEADKDGDFDEEDRLLAKTAVDLALSLVDPTDPFEVHVDVAPGAFGAMGATGVRPSANVSDSEEIRSRGFVDLSVNVEGGTGDPARWVVGILPVAGDAWSDVVDPEEFFWGHPDGSSYEWNSTATSFNPDKQLDVIFCSDGEVPIHANGEVRAPRVFKGDGAQTVLQTASRFIDNESGNICDTWVEEVVGSQNVVSAFLDRTLGLFLPQPLHASMFGEFVDDDEPRLSIRGVGGSTGDFTPFQPFGADADGFLEFVEPPVFVDDPVVGGRLLADSLKIRARTGGETPVELVRVVLSVENNNGEPAGAELNCEAAPEGEDFPDPDSDPCSEFTNEAGGIATFFSGGEDPNALEAPGKAGGYRLCAAGHLDGFDFAPVCTTEPFNVKNDTGN